MKVTAASISNHAFVLEGTSTNKNYYMHGCLIKRCYLTKYCHHSRTFRLPSCPRERAHARGVPHGGRRDRGLPAPFNCLIGGYLILHGRNGVVASFHVGGHELLTILK